MPNLEPRILISELKHDFVIKIHVRWSNLNEGNTEENQPRISIWNCWFKLRVRIDDFVEIKSLDKRHFFRCNHSIRINICKKWRLNRVKNLLN